MKLRKITIHNFRGIKCLKGLEVSDLNSFVGKNDAGKSSVLKAIDCFFNEKKFDTKDVFKGMVEGEKTIIQLSFFSGVDLDDLALDSDGLVTIRKEFYLDKGKIKSDMFYICNDFQDNEVKDLWTKKEVELNAIIEKLGERVVKSGRGNKNVFRIGQIKALKSEVERKDSQYLINDFLKNLEKAYDVFLPEYSMFEADRDLDITTTNFQSQFKPIISSYFTSVHEKTEEIEAGLEKDLADEFDEIRKFMNKNVSSLKKLSPTTEFDWSRSLKKFDINMQFEGEGFDVPISHKGTGFKRLLMVAYFEYLSQKKTVKNQIFAIEEPEAYLHPLAQEDLLKSIITISKKSQFFLTTHSPIFAGSTSGENSILVTKTNTGISEYYRGEDIIPKIIKELGIKADYNLLHNAKFVIFVEGGDDYCFVKAAANTILSKNLDSEGILCIPGGGSALRNYAELDLFRQISKGNNYAVFVDGDNGDPIKQKEKDRIKSVCDKDKAVFKQLSKREIENYACPECIKLCYVEAIKEKEGDTSQNPKISEIEALDLSISSDVDVEEYLAEKGLQNFKSGKNVTVFNMMTKDAWKLTDPDGEIENFLNYVFSQAAAK